MKENAEPLERLVFDAERLMVEHPPIWRHRNKLTVYDVSCPAGSVHRGQLRYSRWPTMAYPERVQIGVFSRLVEAREDVYDYSPAPGADETVEWHVNFADRHLFVAYGSSLLAQDELQVAEHPALGSLREALVAGGHTATTISDSRPTPILVMGVERRCRLALDRNAEEGRPEGLYGNAFARASEDAVRRATRPLDPPTVTNIVAMAAPSGGYGRYERKTIEAILATAYTGFRAAALETARSQAKASRVLVHTGFWGCGAFGGHRVLMTLLQILAAGMARLDGLIFHTVDSSGSSKLGEARRTIDHLLGLGATVETRHVIDLICEAGFEWGVSDGN
jgi:hypothetical protein